jgi:hypothetical protein
LENQENKEDKKTWMTGEGREKEVGSQRESDTRQRERERRRRKDVVYL